MRIPVVFALVILSFASCAPALTEPVYRKLSHKITATTCGADEVRLSRTGGRVLLGTKTQFSPTDSALTDFSQFAFLKWPESGSSLSGVIVPFVGRGVSIVSDTELAGITGSGRILRVNFTSDELNDVKITYYTRIRIPSDIVNIADGLSAAEIVQSYNDATGRIFSESLVNKGPKIIRGYDGIFAIDLSKDGYAVLSASKQDMRVSIDTNYVTQRTTRTNINRFAFNDIGVRSLGSAGVAVRGRGLDEHSEHSTRLLEGATPMYLKHIHGLVMPNSALAYTPNGFVLNTPDLKRVAESLNIEVAEWQSNGWYLHSASINENRTKVALIFKGYHSLGEDSVQLRSAVVFVDLETREKNRFVCSVNEFNSTVSEADNGNSLFNLPADIDADTKIISEKENINQYRIRFVEESGLGFWHVSQMQNTTPPGRIIMIRGGSAASIYDLPISKVEEHYLKQGFEIVRIEYSGAVGTGSQIFRRLLSDRDDALRADSQGISTYVRELRSVARTIVIADSFGSLLAGHLVQLSPSLFEEVVLTSPLLKWSPETDYSNKSEKELEDQKMFDLWTYGAPRDLAGNHINISVEAAVHSLCSAKSIMVFIGADDNLSHEADWMAGCSRQGVLQVIEGVGHSVINTIQLVAALQMFEKGQNLP